MLHIGVGGLAGLPSFMKTDDDFTSIEVLMLLVVVLVLLLSVRSMVWPTRLVPY